MLVLGLLGTLCLRGDTGPVPLAAQQKRRLGLLAILGLGGRQGLSRDRIEAYLWPESADALARHALDQAVYSIRHALGSDVIISTGREIRLNSELVQVDLWNFDDAVRAHDWTVAANAYKGTLLDGFHFSDSRELESWIDTERARVRAEYQAAVEFLANQSAEAGDHSQSVTWWRKLANSDPLSAGATKKLMLALAAAGDRAAAVKHARLYQELVRQELEMEPDSEIERLAATLSNGATTGTVTKPVRRDPPALVTASSSDIARPLATESDSSVADRLQTPPGKPLRSKRSRIATVLAFSVLMVLLIGAVAVENRQRRGRRYSADETGSGHESRITLPGARAAYVRGLNAWSDGSKDGLDTAVAQFHRATELDSQYAEAYAGLADAYVMQGYFGYRPREDVFPKAKEAALRSMQLDSALPSAHPALAYELAWERDFVHADSEFSKAVALDPTLTTPKAIAADPTYAMAHQWYAILLMILSQRPGAVAATPRAPNPFSLTDPVVEIKFTKWMNAYPALTGNTSYGAGTLAGQVLSRIDDSVSTHISARYEITDPGGTHSFKAVIQGKGDLKTGRYDLNGIVTWGWKIGAHVHATFLRITPCKMAKLNMCFRGTIQLQRP